MMVELTYAANARGLGIDTVVMVMNKETTAPAQIPNRVSSKELPEAAIVSSSASLIWWITNLLEGTKSVGGLYPVGCSAGSGRVPILLDILHDPHNDSAIGLLLLEELIVFDVAASEVFRSILEGQDVVVDLVDKEPGGKILFGHKSKHLLGQPKSLTINLDHWEDS
jgi:hypothetical protein